MLLNLIEIKFLELLKMTFNKMFFFLIVIVFNQDRPCITFKLGKKSYFVQNSISGQYLESSK